MTILIEKYRGTYTWSIASIPTYTEEQAKREAELDAKVMTKPFKTSTEREEMELRMLEMYKAADAMRNRLWDWIDDNKQMRIALEAMDIAEWIKKKLAI